jgi:hypothetical protein
MLPQLQTLCPSQSQSTSRLNFLLRRDPSLSELGSIGEESEPRTVITSTATDTEIRNDTKNHGDGVQIEAHGFKDDTTGHDESGDLSMSPRARMSGTGLGVYQGSSG